MQGSSEKIWAAAQQHLRGLLSRDIFQLWFAPLRASGGEAGLTLEVANDFSEVWLKENYLGLLEEVVGKVAGRPVEVHFKVVATHGLPAAVAPHEPAPKVKTTELAVEREVTVPENGFNSRNTFETFVVGNNNNFAYAAAQAVAQAPASR